ncbi:DUF1223 domain-containing protein [Dyadobacter sp. MSC1_007]|jgi:hypothetical protein|uniref:DUF1223 domain-containing protein n=1 Tax=Dyadobacter sp. MSC1_007 TaxID=2909264 RepID=UPI00202DCD0C|nr:DUF1223 domain-containing protein [Dyadobacter sp. MSC1_007]
MKTSKITAFLSSALLTISTLTSHAGPGDKSAPDNINNQGFAVVELFTSEGCSSCPPADKLMAKIQEQNPNKQLYILAFHVDYWNHQGWRDVFSQRDFTKRQYQYANWLKLETVYTPQVVVNGATEFVGSQEDKLNTAIAHGLSRPASARLTAGASADAKQLKLNYQSANAGPHAVLQVALVQKLAHTQVKRGENAGRLLPHVQIVRSIQSYPVQASGHVAIALPDGFNQEDWDVVTFLQNTQTGAILAAARPDFNPKS